MKTTEHELYRTWSSMRTRCNNPNSRGFTWYGARGIEVCDRWSSFLLFVKDMGARPKDHTLDRIDSDGNYEPENCRWATKDTQLKNRKYRFLAYPSQARTQPLKMKCLRGHSFSKENTYTLNSKRFCRKCKVIRRKMAAMKKQLKSDNAGCS